MGTGKILLNFCEYFEEAKGIDISDRMLDGFSQLWIKFAGKANRVHRANLYRYLDDAYVKCYTVWQQLLTNAWGLLQTLLN